jgi:hypothetical protein
MGLYEVSVAMNGKDFVTSPNLVVDIYPDPEILSIDTSLVMDTRLSEMNNLTLQMVGSNIQ